MCVLLRLESECYGGSQDVGPVLPAEAFADTQAPAWMEGEELSLAT